MNPTLRRRAARLFVAVAGVLAPALALPSVASAADSTVRHTGPAGARSIGLIGDSTLSGVRWYEAYGDLDRYSYLFDAESCRRTVERSCWSREQRRADNAITVLREFSGQWGDVLVMMSGYNDSSAGFGDAVDQIVAEAQSQGIATVLWLTLRTDDVNYEEPLHLANGATYRDANRTLYAKAAALGGKLQLADWAGHTIGKSEWFESDGAHLTVAGARAVTTFIADQVDRVLAGEVVTPTSPSWEEIRPGDSGDEVLALQQALATAGAIDAGFVADGDFGQLTESAVREMQGRSGLAVTGVVDATTAVVLGLYTPPVAATPSAASAATAATPAGAPDVDNGSALRTVVVWLALAGLAALAVRFRRQLAALLAMLVARLLRLARAAIEAKQSSRAATPARAAPTVARAPRAAPTASSATKRSSSATAQAGQRSTRPPTSKARDGGRQPPVRRRAPELDRQPPTKKTVPYR